MTEKYRDMTPLERKVYDSVYNGWNMSGVYTVSFRDHERMFRADSLRWLARDVLKWYETHLANHSDDSICVRMLQAA